MDETGKGAGHSCLVVQTNDHVPSCFPSRQYAGLNLRCAMRMLGNCRHSASFSTSDFSSKTRDDSNSLPQSCKDYQVSS